MRWVNKTTSSDVLRSSVQSVQDSIPWAIASLDNRFQKILCWFWPQVSNPGASWKHHIRFHVWLTLIVGQDETGEGGWRSLQQSLILEGLLQTSWTWLAAVQRICVEPSHTHGLFRSSLPRRISDQISLNQMIGVECQLYKSKEANSLFFVQNDLHWRSVEETKTRGTAKFKPVSFFGILGQANRSNIMVQRPWKALKAETCPCGIEPLLRPQ